MAFKKPYDEENLKKKNVRVKNSYYTFSKDYPIGNPSKKARQRETRHLLRRGITLSVCFVLIALFSFFITETGLKFSYKEPTTEIPTTSVTGEQTSETQTDMPLSVRAFFLPEDKISNTKYIKKLINKIRRFDASSVVINFKTQDGHLAYTSKSKYAISNEIALYDSETLRRTISLFKEKNIDVIAQIYCFEDPIVSKEQPALAVKYKDTDVLWLDSTNTDDGKTWLNPYSKSSQKYLFDIIKEAEAFGVKGFILKSVSFPSRGALDTAGYPGEKDAAQRNAVLLSFIKSVKEKVSPDHFVLLSQSTDDTLSGNEAYLFGTLTASVCDGFSADLATRPAEYVIDRKMHYSSILSLLSSLEKSVGTNEKLIYEIGSDEATVGLVHSLAKNGYNNFIVY